MKAYEETDALRPTQVEGVPLAHLVKALELHELAPVGDLKVTGVSVDSSDIAPGDLFVAIAGLRSHGARYAADAVSRGAVAVLTDAAGVQYLEGLEAAVVTSEQDLRELTAKIAATIYDNPSQKLFVAGVTGTNGKTTTTFLLRAMLDTHFGTSALAGTVLLGVGDELYPSPRTTVESPVLQRLLATAVERGASAAVVETSSHAIALNRVDQVAYDVVGFTNLQHDHLDFHHTMEEYLETKASIFTPERARHAVVCVDDEWGVKLADMCAQRGLPFDTVSAYAGEGKAHWWVSSAHASLKDVATTFVLHGPEGEEIKAYCPLPGLVNVQNAALALVMALRSGVSVDEAVEAMRHAHNIPGRMQRISNRDGVRALTIVDYAHTPEALQLALEAVREITPGKLIIGFGSDGDRDKGKRPLLGEIAAREADLLVVTDENPRHEVASEIRAEILAGVRKVRPDFAGVEEITTCRADAVRRCVELAGPDDTVIVTGKGHEPYQEVGDEKIPYNDAPVMAAAVADKWGDK